jgi:hypothetical protein
VDNDGDEDLLVRFLTHQTGIACGDTQASLTGRSCASGVIASRRAKMRAFARETYSQNTPEGMTRPRV